MPTRKCRTSNPKTASSLASTAKLASEVELDQLGIALAKARADTSQARAKLDRIARVLEQRNDKESFDIPDPSSPTRSAIRSSPSFASNSSTTRTGSRIGAPLRSGSSSRAQPARGNGRLAARDLG